MNFSPNRPLSTSSGSQSGSSPQHYFPNIHRKDIFNAIDYSSEEFLPGINNSLQSRNKNAGNQRIQQRHPSSTTHFRNLTPNHPDFYLLDNISLRSQLHPSRNQPLTKQVDQLAYELPNNKYARNPFLAYAPEFIKVFSDVSVPEGARVVFDCVLLGSPRPKVCWLFNDEKFYVDSANEQIDDTADLCRLTINHVHPYHYGVYTVVAENEVGRAVTTATLLPISYTYS